MMACAATPARIPAPPARSTALKTVPVKPEDVEFVKSAVQEISFPAWAEACDKVNPGCSAAWKSAVGPIIGMK